MRATEAGLPHLLVCALGAGGSLVIATWCQREETPDEPFTARDRAALQFLYDEWAHPFFVSVQEYGRLLEVLARRTQPVGCASTHASERLRCMHRQT